VKAHWWDYLLQSSRPRRLRDTLLRHGGPDLAVVVVPWCEAAPHPEKVIEEEEPGVQTASAKVPRRGRRRQAAQS
jgi:hypothetical protein